MKLEDKRQLRGISCNLSKVYKCWVIVEKTAMTYTVCCVQSYLFLSSRTTCLYSLNQKNHIRYFMISRI